MIGILRNKIFEHLRRQSREAPLAPGDDDEEGRSLFDGTGHWKGAASRPTTGAASRTRGPRARNSPRR